MTVCKVLGNKQSWNYFKMWHSPGRAE